MPPATPTDRPVTPPCDDYQRCAVHWYCVAATALDAGVTPLDLMLALARGVIRQPRPSRSALATIKYSRGR